VSIRKLALIVIAVPLLFMSYGLYKRENNPYNTNLPYNGTTNRFEIERPRIQKQLAKLPAEERALVEAYAKRNPRNAVIYPMPFREAIKLQRAWNAELAASEARAAARQIEVSVAPPNH